MKIVESELLDALGMALDSTAPEDAMTTEDIRLKTGWSQTKVLRELRVLSMHGHLVVHRVRRPRLDGVVQMVPAYTVRPKAKKAKK